LTLPLRWIAPGLAAVLLSLAIAAPALGVPSGEEYLPKVPNASGEGSAPAGSGEGSVAAPEAGTGGSATGTGGSAAAAPSQGGPSGGDQAKPATDAKHSKPAKDRLDLASPTSADDSSGGDSALLDPVILLVVGGVILVAVAMIMRGRQVRSLQAGASQDRRELKAGRPTPEGEIVGSGEKPR
jgi:hypothetical protein